MKINNIEVTKEHLEGLQKTITNIRKWIAAGEILVADTILEGLEDNLRKNLMEDCQVVKSREDLIREIQVKGGFIGNGLNTLLYEELEGLLERLNMIHKVI